MMWIGSQIRITFLINISYWLAWLFNKGSASRERSQWFIKVVPASATLEQPWGNIGRMPVACRDAISRCVFVGCRNRSAGPRPTHPSATICHQVLRLYQTVSLDLLNVGCGPELNRYSIYVSFWWNFYLKAQLCRYKQRPSHLRQPSDFSLQVPLIQRSATEAVFSVQGPVLWNKLPHDIKTANSVKIFKKKLKTHFFRIYFT